MPIARIHRRTFGLKSSLRRLSRWAYQTGEISNPAYALRGGEGSKWRPKRALTVKENREFSSFPIGAARLLSCTIRQVISGEIPQT